MIEKILMENKKWAPSQEENLGVITSVYEFIKEELSELQKETGCPDSFIYDFIGKIQNEWHPDSCHSIVRNKKNFMGKTKIRMDYWMVKASKR